MRSNMNKSVPNLASNLLPSLNDYSFTNGLLSPSFANVTSPDGNASNAVNDWVSTALDYTKTLTSGFKKFTKSDSPVSAITNGIDLVADIVFGALRFV